MNLYRVQIDGRWFLCEWSRPNLLTADRGRALAVPIRDALQLVARFALVAGLPDSVTIEKTS